MPETTLPIEHQHQLREAFETLQRRSDRAADGLRDLRERGWRRFTRTGFPTTKEEGYRFTNLRPLIDTPFVLPNGGPTDVAADAIAHWMIPHASARLVFINGRFRADLSTTRTHAGLRVASLAHVLRREPDAILPHLEPPDTLGVDGNATLANRADVADRATVPDRSGNTNRANEINDYDAFADLNTAFLDDGAFVELAPRSDSAGPIHLLFVTTAAANNGDRPLMSHPRNLVLVADGSTATIVEQYVALQDGPALSNAFTRVVVGADASVAHYLLEEESEQAFNISTLWVEQAARSRFESHSALFGGAIVRNNVHVELLGEHCASLVNGLYVGRGQQHLDNHMRVVHGKPHGDSRQFYKGILADRARGVFTGRIVVREDAQKTDAKQTNRNLLLSDDAQINSQPQLEIYADDVKCTHGATTGRLDPEALFYLTARGIPEHEARVLLIHGFARESLERMTLAPVRERLERLLTQRLPQPYQLEAAEVSP